MTMFVDVTHTIATGATTGIQRVVRELARRLVRDGDAVLVAARNSRFYPLDAYGNAELDRPVGNAGASSLGDRRAGSALLKFPALFERIQAWNFNRRIRVKVAASTKAASCRPGLGDTVILLDAFWGGSSAPRAADVARQAGAKVVTVIYDMIPVTHPQFMEPATVAVFGRRIRRAIARSNGVVTISRACAEGVRAFAGDRAPPIRHFYLGGDFGTPTVSRDHGDLTRCFIMVGTVEPRKGHALVLDCFDRLWASGEDVELVFVGRMGWADPALAERLRNHPERGARFRHHEEAGDSELTEIIGRADAVIVASAAEGFGLPVIESLVRGVPVIASDIPVFREVGGEAVLYFAPGDSDALERAIGNFRADPEPWRIRAAEFEWIGWDASADQFVAAMKTVLIHADNVAVPAART
jgi:glycosyltransferase involved in cell wall biosynthesis